MSANENKYKNACIILSVVLVLLVCAILVTWLVDDKLTVDVSSDVTNQNDLINGTHIQTNDTTIPNKKNEKIVYHCYPAHNRTYKPSDPPPVFTWMVMGGFPDSFILSIEYDSNELPITIVLDNTTAYAMSEEQWEFIKTNAQNRNGQQIIHWRIIITDSVNWTEEPYFGTQNRFFIKYDQ